MASIHLEGDLSDSLGDVDVGAVIKFTHLSTTGETIASTESELLIAPDGLYSIDLEYGRIRIDYTTKNTERYVATVVVNQDSTATTLPELLNAAVPETDDVILEMQAILSDANSAATRAEEAAVLSENNVSRPVFYKIDNPTAHLFKKSKVVDTVGGAFEFSRSTSGSYIDRRGRMRSAVEDEAREGRDGWLIESTSTNLFLNSGNFLADSWIFRDLVSLDSGSDITNLIAHKVTPDPVLGIKNMPNQAVTFDGDSYYNLTFIIKPVELGVVQVGAFTGIAESAQLSLIDLHSGVVVSGDEHVTRLEKIEGGAWIVSQRFYITNPSAGFAVAQIYSNSYDQVWQPNGTDSLIIYAAQIEKRALPSSYIQTTDAAATRANDINLIDAYESMGGINSTFTLFGKFNVAGSLGTGSLTNVLLTSQDFFVVLNGGSRVAFNADGDTITSSTKINEREDFTVSLVGDGEEYRLYINGKLEGVTANTSEASSDQLTIRTLSRGDVDDSAGGNVIDFRVYDVALEDSQISFLAENLS